LAAYRRNAGFWRYTHDCSWPERPPYITLIYEHSRYPSRLKGWLSRPGARHRLVSD